MTSFSIKVLTIGLCTLLSTAVSATPEERPFGQRSLHSDMATTERLQPVARVCVEGEECVNPAATEAALTVAEADTALTPEGIYNSKCLACHTTGAAGAPKIGDAAAWQARLDAKGLDGITATAISGIGAMPAKGMCMECSDDDIKTTIEYILEKSI